MKYIVSKSSELFFLFFAKGNMYYGILCYMLVFQYVLKEKVG